MSKPIRLAGTGCCLMDYLYTQVDFAHPAFQSATSRTAGDGGLRPGALVFAEDLERFIKQSFATWLGDLTAHRPPDKENLGGPAIVALIHVAQMLHANPALIAFHAGYGNDEAGKRMRATIERVPVALDGYRQLDGPSPSTVVLSDPNHNDGKGERTFINTLGTAAAYTPDMLGADFFNADVCLFGATALVPPLHDQLTALLQRVKAHGGLNVVGTVYDFRNEQRHPGRPWPLGDSHASYPLIDLLVCDHEEALKMSGCDDAEAALHHFLDGGVGAVVITHGARGFYIGSRDGLFQAQPIQTLPVCHAVDVDLERVGRQVGDTTGCGDNFLGGVLTSLVTQLSADDSAGLDLIEACAWGAASGGFACFYAGGTYAEPAPGAKRQQVEPYVRSYRKQIGLDNV